MAKHKLALIPGDGIGVEVMNEALKVLEAVKSFGVEFEQKEFSWGSNYYFKHSKMMPEDGTEQLKKFDAILFGAVGHEKIQDHITLNGLLLPIRRALNQFACVRPTVLLPGVSSPLSGYKAGDIDIVTIRENTEGEYSNVGGFVHSGFEDEVAIQSNVFTLSGCKRVIKYAYEVAQKRERKHLTSITKSNAQGYSMVLWDRVFLEIGKQFPDVEVASVLVDAACMEIVRNPARFDTVVCSNLFGDIFTDLAAAVTGSIGLAPSGNVNPEKKFPSAFEPTHGSAPDIAGKDVANPVGMILSAKAMLEELGEDVASQKVGEAVTKTLVSGMVTRDLGGTLKCSEAGDAVVNAL